MNIHSQQHEFIGNRITIARENVKLSKVDLANQMHLSRSIIGKWEKGISNPSTAHLVKLASILRVNFEWLATGKESQNLNEIMLDETMQNIKIVELLANLNQQQKHHLLNFLNLVSQ